ncbi:MAG TPA: ABC transporter permease [Candidatus Limnocylindrales bacterium]
MSAVPSAPRRRVVVSRARIWSLAAVPLAVVLGAVVLGAAVILISEPLIPGRQFDPMLWLTAYQAMVEGAIGSPKEWVVLDFHSLVSTFVNAAPLVFGGLAVGFGFKAGLFNIGAQGQFLVGALGAVIVGVMLREAPAPLAVAGATIAGMAFGAAWGFVPGFLKAFAGAHEVVSTIMMNYIAIQLLAALVSGPLKVPRSPQAITFDVGNAALPVLPFLEPNGHLGILLAVIAAIFVWWILYRTTWGFEVRSTGVSPDASRYAGMRPRLIMVATMTFSGMLAGLAGVCVLLGVTKTMTSSFGTTVGFDSIAVALLARSNPLAIVPAALLFGAMRAGAGLMQIQAEIPAELVDVIQALILLALVTSPVIRRLLHADTRGSRGQDSPVSPVAKVAG